MLSDLTDKILNENYHITKQEAISLITADLKELSLSAEKIRKKFCSNKFDMCSIISGKSGKCSENCKFCAQSSHYKTSIKEYPLLDGNEIFKQAKHNADKKVKRFSVVTSGKKLTDEEIDSVCKTYKNIKNKCDILLCASMGLLSYEQFVKLKQSGVTRYHCNLETSRNFFSNICSTHTYDDKINTINLAKKAGLEICSGG
ncbi:MAG: biotin synthase BioB, partial [Endomicrobiaceae bacterium]|nr:biotin synthase BioB [Endomicrobiaceae bacterium]